MEKAIKRRDFLSWVLSGSILVTAVGIVSTVIKYIYPPMSKPSSVSESVFAGLKDDFEPGVGKQVIFAGRPLYVIENKRGEFKALSAICTHLGCIAEWQKEKQVFYCPCHAGVFDDNGKVISGPPPRPLPEYSLQFKEEKIYVAGLKEGERLYGA